MARMARVVCPGVPHHMTQRGVRSIRVFFGPDDRFGYLRLLRYYSQIHGLHFASYTLMDNHVHLVAIPEKEDSFPKVLGEAHRLYTRRINSRTGKRGFLFQGRPFPCPLDDDHFLSALRYVERNPVRAGMVGQPWDYLWSGARFHVGLTETDPLIDFDALERWHLGAEEGRNHLLMEALSLPPGNLWEETRIIGPRNLVSFAWRVKISIMSPEST